MSTETERLYEALNQTIARYAELKHAAAQVIKLYQVVGVLDIELNLAMHELQMCIDKPLMTTLENREES